MQTINIHEAKTQFSRFVEQAAAGEEIIIARAGKPVARLVPLAPMDAAMPARTLGLARDKFTLPVDFDKMSAKAIEAMFERGQ